MADNAPGGDSRAEPIGPTRVPVTRLAMLYWDCQVWQRHPATTVVTVRHASSPREPLEYAAACAAQMRALVAAESQEEP